MTDPDEGKRGISAFIVERDTPGLLIGKDEKKMGLGGSRTVQLTFDQMKVPEENLLGIEGDGFKIALSNLNMGRIGIAAQALGIAEAALEARLLMQKKESSLGSQSLNNKAIAFKLADMATAVESAKLLTYRAAYLCSTKEPCDKEASMAKYFASKTATEVSTEAIQIFGGYGYTKDYPVERYFRDAKVTEIYEGTNEIQRLVISRQLL